MDFLVFIIDCLFLLAVGKLHLNKEQQGDLSAYRVPRTQLKGKPTLWRFVKL